MRVSMRVVTVTLLAGISGWILRGLQPSSPGLAGPRPSAPSAETVALEPAIIPAISIPASKPRSSAGARNLFAYVTHAASAPVPRRVARHVTPERPLADEQPVFPAPEERPKFTHRYIGRFGPDRRPIAAFVREGEIVTVRAGDKIDGTFTLRSIGLESVEIESASGGVRELVPLGR